MHHYNLSIEYHQLLLPYTFKHQSTTIISAIRKLGHLCIRPNLYYPSLKFIYYFMFNLIIPENI